MGDYLPHIATLIVCLITTWGMLRKASKDAGSSAAIAEMEDRDRFRKTLMEQVDAQDKRLKECEAKCAKCESDHTETKQELADTKRDMAELETELNALRMQVNGD